MKDRIPGSAQVRVALQALSHAQMQRLARVSKVPFTTLWKVRSGETENPGIDTVRRFVGHIEAAKAD